MFGAFELALPPGTAGAPLARRRARASPAPSSWASWAASSRRRARGRRWRRCWPTWPPRAKRGRPASCMLATYGVGVGLPLWLLAVFSMSVPARAPGWNGSRACFGVLMFLAALYFLKNVIPALARFTSAQPAFALTMLALIVVGIRAGRDSSQLPRRRSSGRARALGVGLLTHRPVRLDQLPADARRGHQLAWLSDETAAVADARAAGRPLMVDFAADWCLPCKEFDVKVFSRPEVEAEMTPVHAPARRPLERGRRTAARRRSSSKYAADTLPAVRVVSPEGAILARADELISADRSRALPRAAAAPRLRECLPETIRPRACGAGDYRVGNPPRVPM